MVTDTDAPRRLYPLRSDTVTLREESDDGALLFDSTNGKVRVVNATGAAIWACCDGKTSVSNLQAVLRDLFEEAPDSDELIESQILEFLSAMASIDFLEFRDDPVYHEPV